MVSNFTRSHISSDRVRTGYEISLVTLLLNDNNVRSSGFDNMVTLYGHIPQYHTPFVFHHIIVIVIVIVIVIN